MTEREKFKFQQVLRTTKQLKSEDGSHTIAAGTRVVVMKDSGDTVRVKVVDPKFPALDKVRVVAGFTDLDGTTRGRPKGAKTDKTKKLVN